MPNRAYRLFFPVAVWRTRRGDVLLQCELRLPDGASVPLTADDLRRAIDTGQTLPAPAWGYCVQFGGSGRYFTTHTAALSYLCHRWRKAFILRHLDDAVAAAAELQPAALAEAAALAEMWQNQALSGGVASC